MPRTNIPDFSDVLNVPSSARTGSGSGSGLNAGVPGIRGVVAHVQVTAVGGTAPSMVLRLEESIDGSVWVPLATSAAITAVGTYALRYTGFHAAHVRLAWTITGTSPSFTFSHRVLSA